MKKILILEANPRKDLSLNDEISDLQSVIYNSSDRNNEFKIDIGLSVKSTQLQDLMQRYEPKIVHFCGHGSGEKGLVFKDKNIDTNAIASLFELCREHLECVVLNACYSEVQADEINKHIKYVIGMNQAIRDDAAIAFSIGFYRALGYGKSVEDAFKWGKNAIQLQMTDGSMNRNDLEREMRKLIPVGEAEEDITIAEHLKPVLMNNPEIMPNHNQPSKPLKNAKAIATWKEKIAFFEEELPKVTITEKFVIRKQIEECEENIRRLEAE